MFNLQNEDGSLLLMKDGTPFVYTSKRLAQMGKRFLESDRKITLRVVSRG